MNSLSSGYRRFCSYWWKYWLSPRSYYYWLKYKIQRAQRGWADCDVWGLDSYLVEWLPVALRHLKETKHGIPCSMFDGKEYMEYSEEASNRAQAKWDSTLQKMIDGFEAYQRVQDGLYEKELGPYPLEEDWLERINEPISEEMHERSKKAQVLETADMQKFREGTALFIEHFQSLWD